MSASDGSPRIWSAGYLGVMASLMSEASAGAGGTDLPAWGMEQMVRRYFTRAPVPELSQAGVLLRCWLADGMPEEGRPGGGEEETLTAG